MMPKNRMREIRSYGSVGVPAGNRRHYPEGQASCGGDEKQNPLYFRAIWN